MNLKTLALASAILCVGTTALAKLPDSEMALGGIKPTTSLDYIEEIYGAPTTEATPEYAIAWDEYTKTVEYGDSVKILVSSKNENGTYKVLKIKVSANNGFNTPRGLHVGSTRQDVYNTYGKPDYMQQQGKYANIIYKTAGDVNLIFHCEGNKVTVITVGWNA